MAWCLVKHRINFTLYLVASKAYLRAAVQINTRYRYSSELREILQGVKQEFSLSRDLFNMYIHCVCVCVCVCR